MPRRLADPFKTAAKTMTTEETIQRSELGESLFNFALGINRAQLGGIVAASRPDGSVKAPHSFLCAVCGETVDNGDLCFIDAEPGDICISCAAEEVR